MRNIVMSAVMTVLIVSCSSKPEGKYGAAFTADNARSIDEVMADTMVKDGTAVKVRGTVNEACQDGGCWITIKTKDGKEVMISTESRFTIPKNSAGHEALVDGEWMTVEARKEEARKANSKEEEINAISTPMVLAKGIEIK